MLEHHANKIPGIRRVQKISNALTIFGTGLLASAAATAYRAVFNSLEGALSNLPGVLFLLGVGCLLVKHSVSALVEK